MYTGGNSQVFLKGIFSFQEKVLEATDVIKEKAEVLGEKAANAAEAGNEYLAHGAEVVKEYAT